MEKLLALGLLVVLATCESPAFAQRLQTLYRFSGGLDGGTPESAVTIDASGNIFGTTLNGGVERDSFPSGVVFELTSPKAPAHFWAETTLYDFAAKSDGDRPMGPVSLASDGSLFGTTYMGGSSCCGTVFRLVPGNGATWSEQIIYAFTGKGGIFPVGSLVLGQDGSVLGTTQGGGFGHGGIGGGTAYRLTPPGDEQDWTMNILHAFRGG